MHWRNLNRVWLRFPGPVFLLSYRQLQQDPAPRLAALARFLRVPVTASQLDCAAGGEGGFKRPADPALEREARHWLHLDPETLALVTNYTAEVLKAATRFDPGFKL